MKRRKTIKKPSFVISYWQCLAVVAAFLALVGFIIYGNIASEYNGKAMRLTASIESGMNRNIATALTKENVTSQDIAKLKQQLLWHYSSTGQIFEVYYNQKKVLDSSRTMIMHYSPTTFDGNVPLYFLDLADLKYLQYFDTPEVLRYKAVVPIIDDVDDPLLNPKFNEQPVLEIGIREAYIDIENGKFIPVSVYVYDTKDSSLNNKITVDIPIDKDSPELKGYEHIVADGIERESYGGSIEGYAGSSAFYGSEAVSKNDYGIYYGYKCSEIKFVTFEETFKTWIMAGNCALVVLMLALSLIPASLLYNRRKRNYEIFEYRRKATDAMAHDLKTPMAAILSYAENFENNTGSDKREFYVSKISEKVWQMNKMVNNMLDFSRGENTSVVVKKTPIDIGAVIAGAIASNEHEITRRGLTVEFDQKEVTVDTDKELFAQAIGNLINNAALYAKEGTEISVTCESGKIVISNVSAAPVEDAEALKQPFAKGDESRRNYGSGLGLAIAENNLVLLSYKLNVKCEGDRFVVTVTL
ncbi:MAG: HAMP domain-containing histidine kinase [Saccharofermentans sp.]|nr:HAMP domain-containing histidine kinase [Saccharofermentans sp.]